MKVLGISPHTDDIELGVGGTLARYIREGHEVKVLAMSYCQDSRLTEEMGKAMAEIGIQDHDIFDFKRRIFPAQRQDILQCLYDINVKWKPEIVFCPASTDTHQDHKVMYEESIRAFKESSIYGYYIEGNNSIMRPNAFFKLKDQDIIKKVGALLCYESQMENSQRSNYFDTQAILATARHWGKACGSKYAEVFETLIVRQ